MSLVFLKSRDKQTNQQQQRYNPNKPYRFSNYLTQPLRLPPNSQVAYVSSQFTIAPNGNMSNEKTYIITEDKATSALSAPTIFEFPNTQPEQTGNWTDNLNQYVLSANEFSMDSDYTGQIYDTAVELGDTQTKPRTGFQMLYDVGNDKPILRMVKHIPIDQYNLYFNACSSNSDFNFTNGGIYPSGINWVNSTDPKFYDDIRVRAVVPPPTPPSVNPTTSFFDPSNFGLVVGEKTDNPSSKDQVYAGGANFYNTGFSAISLNGNSDIYRFNIGMANPQAQLPDYNAGSTYPMIFSTTGIKKCIGNFTPSIDPQTSNAGGHSTQPITGQTGGYAIWTQSNTLQTTANTHYNATAVGNDGQGNPLTGFTGFAPNHVGVMSIPYIQQIGFENAVANGISTENARNMDIQGQYWCQVNDLNASTTARIAEGSHARYLFGFDIKSVYEGAGTGDCVVQAKVLDCVSGSIDQSFYRNIGNPLSIKKLAQGITTAVTPEYEFAPNATYGINTYTTTAGRTDAMLFFRFRWLNKCQMTLEYTLSVDGYSGTYNNATDVPFEPSTQYTPPTPLPTTIQLDDTTTGLNKVLQSNEVVTFTDSGGGGGNYSSDETYLITFEAPTNQTMRMIMNDFAFEQTNQAFDRMGVQTSNDGFTWTNISRTGFQSMLITDNPNFPTSSDERIFSVANDPANSNNGWIFPRDVDYFTNTLGGDISQTIDFGTKHIRFRFISDSSVTRLGWNLTIFATQEQPANDPRDKWCELATMNPSNDLLDQHYIPTYMGDIGLVQYPISASEGQALFRGCSKGWFNPRQSNRFFQNNNNGGGRAKAPMTAENIFYDKDGLGVLRYDKFANTGSPTLVNSGWTENSLPEQFDNVGWLDSDINYLAIAYKTTTDLDVFRTMEGFKRFQVGEPDNLELGYTLGFNEITDNTDVLQLTDLNPNTKQLLATADISIGSQAFSNHIQLSNLPVISQNGVVSSINKTIYVCDSLCIDSTHDTSSFRYYCDKAPYPLWIDLNNLETIELNKIDVYISTDENTPQKALTGNTQLVIQFRDKTSGQLINSIPVKSMPFTRTY
jgi:hypothetical protein